MKGTPFLTLFPVETPTAPVAVQWLLTRLGGVQVFIAWEIISELEDLLLS